MAALRAEASKISKHRNRTGREVEAKGCLSPLLTHSTIVPLNTVIKQPYTASLVTRVERVRHSLAPLQALVTTYLKAAISQPGGGEAVLYWLKSTFRACRIHAPRPQHNGPLQVMSANAASEGFLLNLTTVVWSSVISHLHLHFKWHYSNLGNSENLKLADA